MLAHEGHASARRFFTSGTAPSYDMVSLVATFGRDRAWKHRIVSLIDRHENVLDLASGTGILSSMIKDEGISVTGLDLSSEYLARSRTGRVCQGTAELLPFKGGTFDAVVSSYLAKYVNIELTMSECWRILKHDGIAVFHDFACPAGAMYGLWKAYFSILRPIGLFSKSWRPVFEQLDDVICQSGWVHKVPEAMKEYGYQNINVSYHTFGTAAIVWGFKQ